jgi:Nuclear pore complex assembly
LAYYHTVNPPLASRNALDAFFDCLCWVSVPEAFLFSRTQPETLRRFLFEQLIKFVLSGTTTTRLSRRRELAETERANKALELINLPLTEDENQWFEEYLVKNSDNMLRDAKDTLLMRRIGTGRLNEALRDQDGLNTGKLDGINWEALRPGIEKGLGPRKLLEEIGRSE